MRGYGALGREGHQVHIPDRGCHVTNNSTPEERSFEGEVEKGGEKLTYEMVGQKLDARLIGAGKQFKIRTMYEGKDGGDGLNHKDA